MTNYEKYKNEMINMLVSANKYHAKKTTVDGITFDSRKEAERYKELKALELVGKIDRLELQPRFVLMDGFRYEGKAIRKIEYVADFLYRDLSTLELVVEDVKGVKTDVYKLKKKLFLKHYGNEYKFVEV